ncbi:MAG: hypothetical protein IPP17_30305 [Bacteroidetes bacterium]|nr:hypothetical protein [Bacteroidota bacterium]
MNHDIPKIAAAMRDSHMASEWVALVRDVLDHDALRAFYRYSIVSYSDIYLRRLFLKQPGLLERLDLQDWIMVVRDVVSQPSQFQYVISFFYKFVGVDLLATIERLDPPFAVEHRAVFQFTRGLESLFGVSKYDLRELANNDLHVGSFAGFQQLLVAEGAVACVPGSIAFGGLVDY